jgi:hypothetical protein
MVFRIHKTRGTTKIVNVEADFVEFEKGGAVSFWKKQRLVMAYAGWAWKTVSLEADDDAQGNRKAKEEGRAGAGRPGHKQDLQDVQL